MNKKIITENLKRKFLEFDLNKQNPYFQHIQNVIEKSVSENLPISLITFTCSTIKAEYLFTKTPWKYVSLSTAGNNLQPDLLRLAFVVKELQKIYQPIKLYVIVGNTDPYYIYLRQFVGFEKSFQKTILSKFARRWQIYKKKLNGELENKLKQLNFEVISWYEYEKELEVKYGLNFEQEFTKTLNNVNEYFNQSDLKWELGAVSSQFEKEKYFQNLKRPNKKNFAGLDIKEILRVRSSREMDLRTIYQRNINSERKAKFAAI